MQISREVIEAEPRKLKFAWNLENQIPCKLHVKRSKIFVKNFVPWALVRANNQTIFSWACSRLMANKIIKEIDKEIVEMLSKLK